MSEDREHRIRERAHSLWEADGCPEGRAGEYWFRAVKSIESEDDPDDVPELMTNVPV